MTIDLQDRLHNALTQRARQAHPIADLDGVIAGRRRLVVAATGPAAQHRRYRSVAWLGAAAVLALAIGGAWMAQRDDHAITIRAAADPGTPRLCAVFLVPIATPAQAEAVGAVLTAMPGVSRLVYMTQADAYREFVALFADRPALVNSVSQSVLPSSWRFDSTLEPDQTTANLAPLRADSSVYETRCGTNPGELAGGVVDVEGAMLTTPTGHTGTSGSPDAGSSLSTGEPGR